MSRCLTLGLVSDLHYASAAEQARGDDFEFRLIANPVLRLAVRAHRYWFWRRHPLRQNHLLDAFLAQAGDWDYLIANGDYSCDTAFIGVSDDAALASARECLDRLRGRFGERLRANFGDHELGKLTLVGGHGGMRLASWRRACAELGLAPFWRLDLGRYVLLGVVSSLIALPVLEAETLPEEQPEWRRLRAEHLAHIRAAFARLTPRQQVVLFCHDPTALPFLAREEIVGARLGQIALTVIGHLHSNLLLWESRLLAGMPAVTFLGNSIRRMTTALRDARTWRAFRVRLCPALAGIQLLQDGGYCTVELDPTGDGPPRFQTHRLRPRTPGTISSRAVR